MELSNAEAVAPVIQATDTVPAGIKSFTLLTAVAINTATQIYFAAIKKLTSLNLKLLF